MGNNYVSWYLYESFILACIFIEDFTQRVLFGLETLQLCGWFISQIRMLHFIITGAIVAENFLPIVCSCIKSFVLFNILIMEVILALSRGFVIGIIDTKKEKL